MCEISTVKHPGEILLTEINRVGMKQKELAIRTGMTEKHISTVINGSKNISPAFARKLDIALGSEKGTWAKYQAAYDEYVAQVEEANGITEEEISILKSLKDIIDYFLSFFIMHNHCGDAEKVLQLRSILCVNSLTVIPKITYNAAYRAQVKTSTSIDPYVLFAWQRLCELETDQADISVPFDSQKLIQSIHAIKKLMYINDADQMIAQLKAIFASCGIAFEVVHHFRGAPVQGFIKQTNGGKVILCLTIRGKKADIFWFSLFHEIGHLLNGDLDTRFIDFESVKSEMENTADQFARDTLIDSESYKSFISTRNFNNLLNIKSFANSICVPYWIVIGRLHSDQWLEWNYYANEAPSFEWVD